jgi:heterotetrameric sarcosine oxidase gamma subunit
MEGGCVSDVLPLARSPIAPAPPVAVTGGWEVSARRSTAALTITDCTPLTKIQVRAPIAGPAAAALGVRFGRAARDASGTLVVGSGPGEWLLLAGPGQDVDPERVTAPDPSASWVDLTHGRALIRLNGKSAASVLAQVCGVDLSDTITPDGAAFRTSVAALATDVIRDDLPGAAGANRDGRPEAVKRAGEAGGGWHAGGSGGVAPPGSTPSYLLHCERSSGQYLFDALLRAGADLGIEIDGFRMPDALPEYSPQGT